MARQTATTISWLFCFLALSSIALGVVPNSLSGFVTQPTLNEQDKSKIKEYSDYYVGLLADGGHEDVMRARTKLVEPMKSMRGRASSAFRSAYAANLLPSLENILELDDVYRGVNAIQVAGFLGTDSSIRMLRRRSDISNESNASKRLWIAIALRKSMESGELSLRNFNAAVRSLAEAAEAETDWRVLMRQLEAVSSVARSERTRDEGGEDLRSLGRELQLKVIKSTLDRILAGNGEKSGNVELVYALRPIIFDVQQQYLDPDLIKYRREVGLNMAPQLARIYDVVLLHYDTLQGDEDLKYCCGLSLRLSEETMRLIETDLGNGQAPQVDPEDLWLNNQRGALQGNRDAWGVILTRSPYTGR